MAARDGTTVTPGNPGSVVVALGGNAILQQRQKGTAEEQTANIRQTSGHIAGMVAAGWLVTVTHGNGPQVGNILLQNEEARAVVSPLPLDACGAETQGLLGYWLAQALREELRRRGIEMPVSALVTQVVVGAADPAFQRPTKPVGPFYREAVAREYESSKGYRIVNTGPKGWRRVVPSPDPLSIVEIEAVRQLVRAGQIVVACGGGGVPVVLLDDGSLRGVEAVIDKDLAGERLATALGVDELLILTDVQAVELDYGKPTARPVARLTPAEGRRLMAEGQFPPGSMGPKVEACLRFLEHGGRRARVGHLSQALGVLSGLAGTLFEA